MRIKTHTKRNEPGGNGKLVLLAVFCGLFCLAIASAQSTGSATIKKFKAPLEYFDPPHELQVKSYLEGAEAEPQGDGLFLVRDAKLQTYQENGAPELTVTTPQCFFNMKDQTVNSAGPFQMRTSDDALLQEGVGFFWQKTNSELIISNRVQTTVKGRMTNSFAP
jgi:hypothetical protein